MTTYFAAHAWLPAGLADRVCIEVDGARITTVRADAEREPADVALPGLVLPGFANTHSHAFHRALRGRTHGDGGTFWTWREQMYAVAAQLDPDSYHRLARAVFAEMALAGVTCVGEFHYLHHAPGGVRYADPNAMGAALMQAAADAGIRVTLLDACYLSGGLAADGPQPLAGVQLRFDDVTADGWSERFASLRPAANARIGAAIHSVRAVPREQLPTVVAAAHNMPLHVHLSEQIAENEQCVAAYGLTPMRLLHEAGALGASSTAVHATHVTGDDIAELGASGTSISMCPTTERDLADGIGPARQLRDAGCPIVLGSDQHAVIDLIEEARALEMDERLATRTRGRFTPDELVEALTVAGHHSLGWPDAGRIEAGARADLVALRLDTVRTAGALPAQALLAASAADVDTVIVDGRVIVQDGRHHLGDVARLLTDALR
ncbi:MAG TPA: formimidoylglutamate deiminase [Jatrophihabitantaceae bacterium]|nr:formimidoylglutamate deiminase [Jatrophihabitantaceae bacterium]